MQDIATTRSSQTTRAVMELRALITRGEIAPGERVSEIPLSQRISISRTPIRAAFSRLEREGLLERLANGGYAVRRISLVDAGDAIELRGVLEGTALRLAAERGADRQSLAHCAELLDGIDTALAPGTDNMDFDAYVELNATFHDTMSGLCQSETFIREVTRASNLPLASPSAFLAVQAQVPQIRKSLNIAQAQHRAMLEAVTSREGARAEAIAREHARLARQNLEYVLHHDRSLIAHVPGLSLIVADE